MSDWPPPPGETGYALLKLNHPDVPTVSIVVGLEDEPRVVFTTFDHEADSARLLQWVANLPPAWREIFHQAFELEKARGE